MDRDLISALKTLTDATRLRIVGRLAAGPATVDQLIAELGIPRAVVIRHLGQLRAAGLIAGGVTTDAQVELRLAVLIELGRALDGLQREAEHRAAESFVADSGVPAEDAKVLRAFIVDGRLVTIPASGTKRLVVLRYLRDECFADDRDYPEKEVNQRLAIFHPDVAAIRRYLVDTRLMTRDAGVYRRATPPGSSRAGR